MANKGDSGSGTNAAKQRGRILLGALLFSAVASPAWAAQWNDLLMYTIVGGKEVTITGYVGMGGKLVIPPAIEGLPVTRIGEGAFKGHVELTHSVTIPDSVTEIGERAFAECRNMQQLIMGAKVTEIGNAAFSGCFSLEGTITVPDGVEVIKNEVFYACSNLVGVVLGTGVSSYYRTACERCMKLKGIYFKGERPIPVIDLFRPYSDSAPPCSVYYIEEQEGWDGGTFLGHPTAGWTAAVTFNAGSGTPAYPTRTYLVGHTYGVLPTATRFLNVFAGWRTDNADFDSVITVDSTVPYTAGSIELYATWALPFQKVTFDTQGGSAVSPLSVTVTYGATYGTLPLTSRKGYSMRGWFLKAEGSGSSIRASTRVTALGNHTLYAVWTPQQNSVFFNDGQQLGVNPGQKTVLFDAPYGKLPHPCRLGYAFGGWWTGWGGVGVQVTESTSVTEAEDHSLYAKWTYDPHAEQPARVGVKLWGPLPDTFANASAVTVKGLPTGLKFDSKQRLVTGTPTKAGSYAVTISAQGAEPLQFTFKVEALPVWASGAFSGFHTKQGVCSMTVSALGKVTGKLSHSGTNYVFSDAYMEGGNPATGFRIACLAKAGKTVSTMELNVLPPLESAPYASGETSGGFHYGLDTYWIYLWRDFGKEQPAALAPYVGYYTATLSGSGQYGSGYLTFTVDKAGKVKAAGKLSDGTAVSLSGSLVMTAEGYVFFPFYASPAVLKGGQLYGGAEFLKGDDGKMLVSGTDFSPVYWLSLNPEATAEYGKGFDRELGLTGGRYDKLENLYTYFRNMDLSAERNAATPAPELWVGNVEYPSAKWDFSGLSLSVMRNKAGFMTGLSAPAAGKPADPEKDGLWDYSAQNVVGLKISLTQATGLFKGSFLAWFDYPEKKHVSKALAFEGVLTPVRMNSADGIAGRGFFLWPDKAGIPETPFTYPFKWSYEFLLRCQ